MRTRRLGDPELGKRIQRFMEEKDLDLSALSTRTGISDSYLGRIVRGEVTNPTLDFVLRIATGLGVKVSELVGEPIQFDEWGRYRWDIDLNLDRTLGEIVKSWQKTKKLKISDIITRGGKPLTPPYLSEVLHGRINTPGKDYLKALARGLGIPVICLHMRLLPTEIGENGQVNAGQADEYGGQINVESRFTLEALSVSQLWELLETVQKLLREKTKPRYE